MRWVSAVSNRRGLTLVEVLASLVILSIGLLAVAQLFWRSNQMSTGSYLRTIAHIQAIDMGERMWLNLADPLDNVAGWQEDHPSWEGEVDPDADDAALFEIILGRGGPGGTDIDYSYLVRVPEVSP